MAGGFNRRFRGVPDRVYDALVHFSAEVGMEVMFAVRDYSRHWDIYRSDEGYSFSHLSDAAKGVFLSVLKELYEFNANYFKQNQAQVNNANAGVEKREERKREITRQQKYYQRHKEKISAQRREKRQTNKPDEEQLSNVFCNTKNEDKIAFVPYTESDSGDFEENGRCKTKCNTKDEKCNTKMYDKNVANDYQIMNSEDFFCADDVKQNVKQNSEIVKQNTLDNGTIDYMEQEAAENSATADRIIGYKTNFKEKLVVIKERGCGGKPVVNNQIVDKSGSHNPSSGLTGNNRSECFGSKGIRDGGHPTAVGGTPQGVDKGLGIRDGGYAANNRHQSSSLPKCSNKPPTAGLGKDGLCRGSVDNEVKIYRWKPGNKVLIDDDFKIDFLDPIFTPLQNVTDTFLIKGVEIAAKKYEGGRKVEKKWLWDLFQRIAIKQGKLEKVSECIAEWRDENYPNDTS